MIQLSKKIASISTDNTTDCNRCGIVSTVAKIIKTHHQVAGSAVRELAMFAGMPISDEPEKLPQVVCSLIGDTRQQDARTNFTLAMTYSATSWKLDRFGKSCVDGILSPYLHPRESEEKRERGFRSPVCCDVD